MIYITFGFSGLYATLVYVAIGQLEKLNAALLGVTQTYVTSQEYIRAQTGQQEGQERGQASEDMFQHMQEQLNNSIRHHQKIQRCVYN
jgi:predicted transcriptional regulator